MIAYDNYVENDYAVDGRRDEGYDGGGFDDGTDVYASWRLGYTILLLLCLSWLGYVLLCFILAVFALDFRYAVALYWLL